MAKTKKAPFRDAVQLDLDLPETEIESWRKRARGQTTDDKLDRIMRGTRALHESTNGAPQPVREIDWKLLKKTGYLHSFFPDDPDRAMLSNMEVYLDPDSKKVKAASKLPNFLFPPNS